MKLQIPIRYTDYLLEKKVFFCLPGFVKNTSGKNSYCTTAFCKSLQVDKYQTCHKAFCETKSRHVHVYEPDLIMDRLVDNKAPERKPKTILPPMVLHPNEKKTVFRAISDSAFCYVPRNSYRQLFMYSTKVKLTKFNVKKEKRLLNLGFVRKPRKSTQ